MDDFFKDTGWHQFSRQLTKMIGAFPNHLYSKEEGNLGAVVAFRGAHASWAVNNAAIKYVHDAVREGRISQGYAILAEMNNPHHVVSWKPIEDVVALLAGVSCRQGEFGPYCWINKGFTTDQTADLANAPF